MKQSLLSLAALALLAACGPEPRHRAAGAPAAMEAAPPITSTEQDVVSRGVIPASVPKIKVALLVPLSGESVAVGNAMLDAASLAVYDGYLAAPSDSIRSEIVLMPRDTGNTPAEALRAAKAAIDQGATFIVGPLFSQSVSAIAPLAKEHNVPMLTFSNNKAVAGDGVYTFGFLPEQQVMRMAEYAYLHRYTRVAILAPNDGYGSKVKDTFAEAYAKRGGMASPSELYAPSPANIDAAVSRLVNAYNGAPDERRFQAIFIADGGVNLKNVIASLKKTNLDLKKIKLIGTGLWDDPDIAKIPEMESAWFPSSPPDIYQNFERRFMAGYHYKPVRLASLAYDAISVITALSMPTSESGVNGAALLDPAGYRSPANGLFRLRADGTSERKLAIMEIGNGGFKVIDRAPDSFDTIKFAPTAQP